MHYLSVVLPDGTPANIERLDGPMLWGADCLSEGSLFVMPNDGSLPFPCTEEYANNLTTTE